MLDRLQGLDDRKFLHYAAGLAAAADAGGVDQRVAPAVALEGNFYTVPGRARLVEDQYPVFAQQAVDEGGFADIGPAGEGNPDAAVIFVRSGMLFRFESIQHMAHELFHAGALGGRDGEYLPGAEFMKLRPGLIRVESVGLVHHEEDRLALLAQELADPAVFGCQTVPCVDHE